MGVIVPTTAVPRGDLLLKFNQYLGTGNFVADRLFPWALTEHERDTIMVTTRASRLAKVDTRRAKNNEFTSVDLGLSSHDFVTREHGLVLPVDQGKEYPPQFSQEEEAMLQLSMMIGQARESELVTALQDTSVFTAGTGNYKATSGAWSSASSDIIGDVGAAKDMVEDLTGMRPQYLVVDRTNWGYIKKNTAILARFPGIAMLTEQQLRMGVAAIFDLDEVIVSSAVYNGSADTPDAFTATQHWGSTYASVVLAAPANSPVSTPGIGRTLRWKNYPGANGEGQVMEYWYDEDKLCWKYRQREKRLLDIFDPGFACLIKTTTG